MPNIELTNMVMVYDTAANKALVIDRVKSWAGLSFPGGHVEEGESFTASAVREIKEETGLDIRNLKLCGILHWVNAKTLDRYIEFLYKTTDFSGNLLDKTEEGRIFWLSPDEIIGKAYTNNFHKYFPLFFEDRYSEGFGEWDGDGPGRVIYQ